jgi:hypothetical protein
MVADAEDLDRRPLARSTIELSADIMIVGRRGGERGGHETSRQAL